MSDRAAAAPRDRIARRRIAEIPEAERPRERLAKLGADISGLSSQVGRA